MRKYDIAAIIWPAYTGDEARTRIFWPDGIGEWQTVKAMENKGYDGCTWPRKPLWGYENEADPEVMEKQIQCALDHGVNTFIYDWYWYDNRPFLENCLNDGFLKARNNQQMQFYLMWANHDAAHLWDKRNADSVDAIIWSAVVTSQIFLEITERTIEKYFKRENYYKIDGCPVYMIYEIDNLIRSFGTTQNLKKALDAFRQKTMDAGLAGLHLQCVMWPGRIYHWLSDEDECKGMTMTQLLRYLGFDSVTDYNWSGSVNLDGDYRELTDAYMKNLQKDSAEMPFYPNLTIGWDNNVRFRNYVPGVVRNNTPENFQRACEMVKNHVDKALDEGLLKAPLITVNSWNEWTETSYLEPDDLYGYGYLEAVKAVFKAE